MVLRRIFRRRVKVTPNNLWLAVKELGPHTARLIDLDRTPKPKQALQLTLILREGDYYAVKKEAGVTTYEVQIVDRG